MASVIDSNDSSQVSVRWAHSCSEPKNRHSNEKTYGYRSIRHSLARGKVMCQSSTEHTQVGRTDTLHQQCLASRIIPITSTECMLFRAHALVYIDMGVSSNIGVRIVYDTPDD